MNWLESVVAEWKPRPMMGGAEWAEEFRVLSPKESPAPGKWRTVEWQREILNALADVTVVWLVILKAAQMGVSEIVRCAIGRWALLDPGDVLWVMTTQEKAEGAMKKLRDMFEATPALQELLSGKKSDATLLEMNLVNGMRIVIGWAGSAQSLASDPFRRVILDEAAKYKWSVQGEASPVDLAKERTKVFGLRGKIVLLSSPKHSDDIICTAHREESDRRSFAVYCVCGELQSVDWSFVRWPGGEPATAPVSRDARVALAGEVETDQSAWLECRKCKGKIQPQEVMSHGKWIQDGDEIGRRRAYHVPEFFHWETTLSALVAKFLRCHTPSAIQGFYNGSLGLAYHSGNTELEANLFAARATFPARVVPAWATTVIATADTQKDGWWYVVRAWGPGKSRLLDWGFVNDEDLLTAKAVTQQFPVEGSPTMARIYFFAVDTGGGMLTPDGSRTREVYDFVKRTSRAHALKGEGNREALQGPPWRKTQVPMDKAGNLVLYLVNKSFYADELYSQIRGDGWEECVGAENPVYGRQMSSEHKVTITKQTGTETLWQKKTKSNENHLWDCSRYQCWAAEVCQVESRKMPTWQAFVRKKAEDDGEAPPRERYVIGRE